MRRRFMHPSRVARRQARRHKIGSFLRKADGFLRRTKVLSKIAARLPPSNPYMAAARAGISAVGYGRRRRRCGGGVVSAGRGVVRAGGALRSAGGALRRAGEGMRRRRRRKKKACCSSCSH